MENYQSTPSDIYIPQEQALEEVIIYGHTKEVVYKRETSNGLFINAIVCHHRDFSSVDVKITDEGDENYVNAFGVHIWGAGHERCSEQMALSYLDGPELPTVCAGFYSQCICTEEENYEAQSDEFSLSLF